MRPKKLLRFFLQQLQNTCNRMGHENVFDGKSCDLQVVTWVTYFSLLTPRDGVRAADEPPPGLRTLHQLLPRHPLLLLRILQENLTR